MTYPRQLGRFRSTDMIGPGRAVRDQGEGEEESEGELLCRLTEGRDGNFTGHDAKGRVLRIRRAKDGALEVMSPLAETEDDADPDITGVYPGVGGDPARATGRPTGDAMARFARTGDWAHHGAALAEYQKKIDAYYGNNK